MKEYQKPNISLGSFLQLISSNPQIVLVDRPTGTTIFSGTIDQIRNFKKETDATIMDRVVTNMWKSEYHLFLSLKSYQTPDTNTMLDEWEQQPFYTKISDDRHMRLCDILPVLSLCAQIQIHDSSTDIIVFEGMMSDVSSNTYLIITHGMRKIHYVQDLDGIIYIDLE